MRKYTLLPLETLRDRLGFTPYHFWGFRDSNFLQQQGSCDPVLMESTFQAADRAGRDDFRRAITAAVDKIAEYTGMYPAPNYVEDTVDWPLLQDHRMIRGSPMGADWRRLSVTMPKTRIQAIGVRALEVVQLNVPIVYTDPDGDGYPDIATIGPVVLPTSVTRESEVALYFSVGDRTGFDTSLFDDTWIIEPIYTKITGGNATITVPPWILGRPVLYEGMNPQHLDPANGSPDFCTTVDVYRRYTKMDGQTTDDSQAVIIWETRPSHGWWCCCGCSGSASTSGSPYDPAAQARAVGRAGIRNSERGEVTPAEAVYNATDNSWSSLGSSWCYEPDRVLLRYLAGFPLDKRGFMDSKMQEIVTNLAIAELVRPACGCESANRAVGYLQYDLARIGQEQELFQVSDRTLNNKFGTRRGHVLAWQALDMLPDLWGGTIVG